jgi:prepilin-type N-terminal cleavage/methylation domain-containing protein
MHNSLRGYTLIELLLVLGLMGVVCAMVIPITSSSIKGNRLRGDANAIRNFVGLAKMRASSQSTRARVYADLGTNSYALEVWDRTDKAWVNESGTRRLAAGVTFGFLPLATPPPDTQVEIAMSPACTPGLTATGAVEKTACITFNSRGLPVDADGKLFPKHALYLQGDLGVFATTVTQTPLIRLWSSPSTTAFWTPK